MHPPRQTPRSPAPGFGQYGPGYLGAHNFQSSHPAMNSVYQSAGIPSTYQPRVEPNCPLAQTMPFTSQATQASHPLLAHGMQYRSHATPGGHHCIPGAIYEGFRSDINTYPMQGVSNNYERAMPMSWGVMAGISAGPHTECNPVWNCPRPPTDINSQHIFGGAAQDMRQISIHSTVAQVPKYSPDAARPHMKHHSANAPYTANSLQSGAPPVDSQSLLNAWNDYLKAYTTNTPQHPKIVPGIPVQPIGFQREQFTLPLLPHIVLELRSLEPRDRYSAYLYYKTLVEKFLALFRAGSRPEAVSKWQHMVSISTFLRIHENTWYKSLPSGDNLGRIIQDQLKPRTFEELGIQRHVPLPTVLVKQFPALFPGALGPQTASLQAPNTQPHRSQPAGTIDAQSPPRTFLHNLGIPPTQDPGLPLTPRQSVALPPALEQEMMTRGQQTSVVNKSPSSSLETVSKIMNGAVGAGGNRGDPRHQSTPLEQRFDGSSASPISTGLSPKDSNGGDHETIEAVHGLNNRSPYCVEAPEVAWVTYKYLPPSKPTKGKKGVQPSHGDQSIQASIECVAHITSPDAAVTAAQTTIESTVDIQQGTQGVKRHAEDSLADKPLKVSRLDGEAATVSRDVGRPQIPVIIDLTSDVDPVVPAPKASKRLLPLVDQEGYTKFREQQMPGSNSKWRKDHMKLGGASNKQYAWMAFAETSIAQAEAERIKRAKSKKPSPTAKEDVTADAFSVDVDISLYLKSGTANRYQCEHQVFGESEDCKQSPAICSHRCCEKGITERKFQTLLGRVAAEDAKKKRRELRAGRSVKALELARHARRKGNSTEQGAPAEDQQATQASDRSSQEEELLSSQPQVEIDLYDDLEAAMLQEFNDASSPAQAEEAPSAAEIDDDVEAVGLRELEEVSSPVDSDNVPASDGTSDDLEAAILQGLEEASSPTNAAVGPEAVDHDDDLKATLMHAWNDPSSLSFSPGSFVNEDEEEMRGFVLDDAEPDPVAPEPQDGIDLGQEEEFAQSSSEHTGSPSYKFFESTGHSHDELCLQYPNANFSVNEKNQIIATQDTDGLTFEEYL